ncbi:MAG: hypothetical protein KAH03_00820 [Cocleimonas sp.]|nr:hypothetical protein [Cocleimonas sp.]
MACLDLILDDGTTQVSVIYQHVNNFNYQFPNIETRRSENGALIIQQSCTNNTDSNTGKLSVTFSGVTPDDYPFASLDRHKPWTLHCVRPLLGHGRTGRVGALDHPILQVYNTSMTLNGQAKSAAAVGGLQFSFTLEEI